MVEDRPLHLKSAALWMQASMPQRKIGPSSSGRFYASRLQSTGRRTKPRLRRRAIFWTMAIDCSLLMTGPAGLQPRAQEQQGKLRKMCSGMCHNPSGRTCCCSLQRGDLGQPLSPQNRAVAGEGALSNARLISANLVTYKDAYSSRDKAINTFINAR